MKYSLDMTLKQLNEDECAAALFDRFVPGMRRKISGSPMAAGLSLRKLLSYTGSAFPEEASGTLDQVLREYGKTADFTPAEKAKMAAYQAIAEEDERRKETVSSGNETRDVQGERTVSPPAVLQHAIRPGQVWYDTKGERIQAHGGALHYEDGIYYWYGENKEHTDGKSDIWTWGIRVYRSEDLYNWEDLGLLIPPVLDDPNSNLFPDMRLDRPHIRRCEATDKYVAWIKLSGEEACFLIMQADAFLGPY